MLLVHSKLVEFETKLKNSQIGVSTVEELIDACLSGTLVILPTQSWQQLSVWEETLKKIEDAFHLKFLNQRFLSKSQKQSSDEEDEDGEDEKNVHFQSFGTTTSGADSGSCSSDNSKIRSKTLPKIVVKNKEGAERGQRLKKSRDKRKEDEKMDMKETEPLNDVEDPKREELELTETRKGDELKGFKKLHIEQDKLSNKPKKKKRPSDSHPLEIDSIQLTENLGTFWDKGVFGQENGQWTPKHTWNEAEKKGEERKHKVREIPSFQKALLFFAKEKRGSEGGDPEKMWEMLSDDEKKVYYDLVEKEELSARIAQPSHNLSSNEISEEKTPRTDASLTLTLSLTPVPPPPSSFPPDQNQPSKKIPKGKIGKVDIKNVPGGGYATRKKKKKKLPSEITHIIPSPLSKSSESPPQNVQRGKSRFFSGSGSEGPEVQPPPPPPPPHIEGVPTKFTKKQKLLSGSASSDEDKM